MGEKALEMSLIVRILDSISMLGYDMPPSLRDREEVEVEAGCVRLLCQISCLSSAFVCWMCREEGGATTVWYQILEITKDLATNTLPQRDSVRVWSEFTLEVSLVISESQSVSIFACERGNRTPRVARGSEEGEGVFGGGMYVLGESGIRFDLPQWTSPPAVRLYWRIQ